MTKDPSIFLLTSRRHARPRIETLRAVEDPDRTNLNGDRFTPSARNAINKNKTGPNICKFVDKRQPNDKRQSDNHQIYSTDAIIHPIGTITCDHDKHNHNPTITGDDCGGTSSDNVQSAPTAPGARGKLSNSNPRETPNCAHDTPNHSTTITGDDCGGTSSDTVQSAPTAPVSEKERFAENVGGISGRVRDPHPNTRGITTPHYAADKMGQQMPSLERRINGTVATHPREDATITGAASLGTHRRIRREKRRVLMVRNHMPSILDSNQVGSNNGGSRTTGGVQNTQQSPWIPGEGERGETSDRGGNRTRHSDDLQGSPKRVGYRDDGGIQPRSAHRGRNDVGERPNRHNSRSAQQGNTRNTSIPQGEDNSATRSLHTPYTLNGCPRPTPPCTRKRHSNLSTFHNGQGKRPETDTNSLDNHQHQPLPSLDTQRRPSKDGATRCLDRDADGVLQTCLPPDVGSLSWLGHLEPQPRQGTDDTNCDTNHQQRRRTGWRKYTRHLPAADPNWPIHVKHVEHLNMAHVLRDMTDIERASLSRALRFFTPEFLRNVPCSGKSIIELSPKQVEFLINCGLLKIQPAGSTTGTKLHIFLVAEPHKCRYRLIVHTVDINNYTKNYRAEVTFEPLNSMIDAHIAYNGFTFQNDAASYYHQYPLSEEAQTFFNFEYEGQIPFGGAYIAGTVNLLGP
jgi:hypothetical protein